MNLLEMIDNIDITKLKVTYKIDAIGVSKGPYYVFNEKPDKMGLILLYDHNNKTLCKIHPSRLTTPSNGSFIIKSNNGLLAACPQCGKVHKVKSNKLTCPDHGDFTAIQSNSKDVSMRTDNIVDYDDLKQYGEVWIKDGVNFDFEQVSVKTVIIIGQNKYMSFNIYNDTWGKKNKKPPFDKFMSGSHGYDIKNIAVLKKKLTNEGYKRHE